MASQARDQETVTWLDQQARLLLHHISRLEVELSKFRVVMSPLAGLLPPTGVRYERLDSKLHGPVPCGGVINLRGLVRSGSADGSSPCALGERPPPILTAVPLLSSCVCRSVSGRRSWRTRSANTSTRFRPCPAWEASRRPTGRRTGRPSARCRRRTPAASRPSCRRVAACPCTLPAERCRCGVLAASRLMRLLRGRVLHARAGQASQGGGCGRGGVRSPGLGGLARRHPSGRQRGASRATWQQVHW